MCTSQWRALCKSHYWDKNSNLPSTSKCNHWWGKTNAEALCTRRNLRWFYAINGVNSMILHLFIDIDYKCYSTGNWVTTVKDRTKKKLSTILVSSNEWYKREPELNIKFHFLFRISANFNHNLDNYSLKYSVWVIVW